MATTVSSNPVSSNPAFSNSASSTQAGAHTALTVARRHRAELLGVIHAFESAVAVPMAEADWRLRLGARLATLRSAFAEHVAVTEGGLYAEILDDAPRLHRALTGLAQEHAMIVTAMGELAGRVRVAEPNDLRDWASDLLRELSRHRQRGADLVYEAYATDIGGET